MATHMYLLFESDALMRIIPKKAFASPDDVDAFRSILPKERRAEEPRAS
jgi:YcxB-like protein